MARTSTGKRLLRSSLRKTKARRCHSLRAFVSCGGNIPNISLLLRLLCSCFNPEQHCILQRNQNNKKQTKIRTIHSKSANCADFLMVAPAGVEPAMEESKSSALPLGDGASYKTVYHIFAQTTRAQTKKLSLHTAGRVFLYLSRLSHSGSWASTATRYSARSCWISCRCDPSAAVA